MPQIHSLPRAELEARIRPIVKGLNPMWLDGILSGDTSFEDLNGDVFELAGSDAAERADAGFVRHPGASYATRAVPAPAMRSGDEQEPASAPSRSPGPKSVAEQLRENIDSTMRRYAEQTESEPASSLAEGEDERDASAELVRTVGERTAARFASSAPSTPVSRDPSADLLSLIASRI
jgi:hypothetical protein